MQLLDETSTEIFQRNLIDRYAERPYQPNSINNLCFAQFAAYYYKSVKYSSENAKSMNDDQPEILTDTIMEKQSADENQLPDVIQLLNSKEAMKTRKIRAVVRFHKLNEIKETEKLAHHLLMLYFPWRNEGQLLGESGTYASKLSESSTWRIMERNKTFLEPHELQNAQDIVSRQSASHIYHVLHSSLQGTEEEEESNIASDLLNAQSNSQSRQNSHQLTSRLPVLT